VLFQILDTGKDKTTHSTKANGKKESGWLAPLIQAATPNGSG